MKTLYIKVEVLPGTIIAEAVHEMCATANRLGLACEAKMNGVTVWARPYDDPAQLAIEVDKQLGSNGQFRFACLPNKKVP